MTTREELAQVVCDAIILSPWATPHGATSLSFEVADAIAPFIERAKAEAWNLGVMDGRQSGMLRMDPTNPYDGTFYDIASAQIEKGADR